MTTPQPTRTLPERPNLEHVKKQAKTLLAEYREGTAEAIAEITRFERAPNRSTWGLHDAQRVLARAYGFSSWTKLKEHILTSRAPAANPSATETFLELFEKGDVDGAKALLKSEPALLEHSGYKAHPLIREFINRNDGHCYKRPHVAIAELLLPAEVRAFRDAVLRDRVGDVRNQLRTDPKLVSAEFTGGRGIAQAIHHWKAIAVGELLLDAGADIHVRTTVHFSGETPLAMQLRFGTVESVRFLLQRGADPNRGVSIAMPPSKTMSELIKLLQEHGWDMNAGTGRRRTMLHHDANHGHGSRICIWLEHGADPNIQDDAGRTPLHIIASKGTGREAIRALVEAGADINGQDDEGNAPLDLARVANRQTATRVLLALGAKES